MLAKLRTFSLLGIEAVPVEVEVDVSQAAMPKTNLVGLPPAFPAGQHRTGTEGLRQTGRPPGQSDRLIHSEKECIIMQACAQHPASGVSRRNFLKTSTAVASGALVGGLTVPRAAFARGDDTIKLALIGCGDRGAGAASQALRTNGPIQLWAMADLFADHDEDRPSRGSFRRRSASSLARRDGAVRN